MAVNADGSMIVAGKAEYLSGFTGDKILLAKYSADGKLDRTFGADGLVFNDAGEGADYANAVAVQDDGKIVAAGGTGAGSLNQAAMCISRYNADGSADKSFNQTGIFVIYFGDDNAIASSLVIQPDGKYLFGGTKSPGAFTQNQSGYDFALVSVTKDGNLNTGFGTQGMVTTDFSGLQDYGNAIALQADGKIIAAGASNDSLGTIGYISLARFNNNGLSKKQIIITKIRHLITNNIKLSPNPATSNLHIEGLPSTQTKLIVVDYAGNVKMQAVANSSSYNLNIALLKAGNYLLSIQMNDEMVTKKFVKE